MSDDGPTDISTDAIAFQGLTPSGAPSLLKILESLDTPNPGFFRLNPYIPVPPTAITASGHRRRKPTTYELLTALIEGDRSYLPPPGGPS
jgi:hypothetical protein